MLLGLDLGTTNVKAVVTDFAGRRLGEGSRPVRLFQIGGGGVEQDIEEIWSATLAAVRDAVQAVDTSPGSSLAQTSKAGPSRCAGAGIQAVGVSSQGGAMQTLDAQGRPTGRVISWLDQRGADFNAALGAELGGQWFAERLGHGRAGLAIGQLLRMRQENPGFLAAPNRIGFVGDVIVSRLCGRAAHDDTSCSLTLLYNPTRQDYDPEVVARLGVTTAQLPALLSSRQAAGGLLPSVAQVTGLRPGIPVSAAIHDQYAAALAVEAVQAGTVMVGTGTAWVLLAIGDRLTVPATPEAFVCHHAVEGLWGQILSLGNGGSALAWALDLTGHGQAGGEEIDCLLESAPLGSDGLLCWPLFTALTVPGLASRAKARFSGLQLSHRPGHVVRAVLEGLAFELKRHIGLLRGAGLPIERLVLSGRAATSRVTPQVLAAVTGLPLACAGSGAGSAFGAAIIARGLCEPASPLAKLAEEMAPAASHVEPAAEASLLYQAQFKEYLRALPLPGANSP